MRPRTTLRLLALVPLVLAGCRDSEIRTYRIAKEAAPPAAPSQAHAAAARSAVPKLHYEKPAHWQEQPGKSMRVASFLVAEKDGRAAELAVTVFPGDVGGDFANVNRWRGQIQLAPITEAELPAAITALELPAGRFQLIDLTSETAPAESQGKLRILGAWLKQPDRTWFFKVTGDADLVGTQRDTFLAFLRTVTFTAPEPAAAAPETPNQKPQTPNSPAPSAPETPNPKPQTPNSVSPAPALSLTWTAPAGWTAKPLGAMRKGSYALRTADGAEADLSITQLAATGNPLLANINRWRAQIGLAPLAAADLPAHTTTLAHDGLEFTVIDHAHNGARVLAAILYRGDEVWFFKLSGPDAAVAPHKTAFLEFLNTVNAR